MPDGQRKSRLNGAPSIARHVARLFQYVPSNARRSKPCRRCGGPVDWGNDRRRSAPVLGRRNVGKPAGWGSLSASASRVLLRPGTGALRRIQTLASFGVALLAWVTGAEAASKPIALHPDNPRYFLWRGKPTVLITSGEHYGAVLNLDFDYRKYLDTLAKDKLNLTRTWAGAYAETGGNFNIADNTLNPAAGRFICPWARSDQTGYADGGNKFDLRRWDAAYFQRLKEFVRYAAKKGVVVEMNLFCPMYEESMWSVCPMNAKNNVNGLGAIGRQDPLTLDKSGGLLAVQEAMVRKIAEELRGFDNVYFEIVNEPYAVKPPIPDDWQRHMTDVLADAMKSWPQPFLISWNIANKSAKVANPHPGVSIFNFHYAAPPETVAMNWDLNKVIGDNETGFRGTNDAPYRTEAWDFLIAGGGLFNHLDYSFTVGRENGTFVYPAKQPGGGNPGLRRQFRILRKFLVNFNFVRMKPDNSIIKGAVPAGVTARALVEPGKACAIYVRKTKAGASTEPLQLELAAGYWWAEWIDPLSGRRVKEERFKHGGGVRSLEVPAFTDDAALRLKRQ